MQQISQAGDDSIFAYGICYGTIIINYGQRFRGMERAHLTYLGPNGVYEQ